MRSTLRYLTVMLSAVGVGAHQWPAPAVYRFFVLSLYPQHIRLNSSDSSIEG